MNKKLEKYINVYVSKYGYDCGFHVVSKNDLKGEIKYMGSKDGYKLYEDDYGNFIACKEINQ